VAGNFVSVSSQYIKNAAPSLVSTGYPLTMAAWINPADFSNSTLFGFFSSGGTTNYVMLFKGSSGWSIAANDGSSSNNAATGAATTNVWYFIVTRWVSSTNRWLDILNSDGSTAHSQGTTSKAPTGMNQLGVGARVYSTPDSFSNALIAEFWYADADIQADGGQLDDNLLRRLAYGGPFSVPHIAKDIVEYRSLRKALTSDSDDGNEVYARNGVQTWTQSGSPTVGPHCPVPYWYVKPRQTERILTV
jgi:hypothetical protein